MKEQLDEDEQKTYPDKWDVLEKACIETFPVQIDGVVNLYYEVD
jgi:hypothetical protein